MNRVQRTIKAAGGNKAVASVLSMDTTTVWRIAGFGGDDFSDDQIKTICGMTDGLIRPEQLRAGISGDK